MSLHKVCVFAGSSRQCDPEFLQSAAALGRELARAKITVVYGGGASGAMGHLADAALGEGGSVVGVLPRFMYDLEWGHGALTELHLVNDLHERKRLMNNDVDGIVALPGGSGTFEELLEAITWKRLGLHVHPIILVNVRKFFDPLVELLDGAIRERFMDERHRAMWSIVERAEDVLDAIHNAPQWSRQARKIAAL